MKVLNIQYIAAVIKGTRGISYKGKLPWGHVSKDLKHFRKITEQGIIIMGRKTYHESLNGNLLPNRHNIILSKTLKRKKFKIGNYYTLITDSIEEVLEFKVETPHTKGGYLARAYVIGGGEIYGLFEPYMTGLFLSEIYTINDEYKSWEYDVTFPELKTKTLSLSSTKLLKPIKGDNIQVKASRYSNR